MTGYHDISASEEHCSLCGAQASHKVAEDAPGTHGLFRRHPLTNYACCGCFGRIMGSLAVEWCAREAGVPVGGGEPQPTTSTDNTRLDLGGSGPCLECDSPHRLGERCAPPEPVRSAGGGDQPDTPCPECGGTGYVLAFGTTYGPCTACADKENPHGQ